MQTHDKKLAYLRKTIETLWHGVEDTKTGDYPKIVNLYKEVLKIEPKTVMLGKIWSLMWSLAVNNKDTAWLLEAEKFVKRYLAIMPNGYRPMNMLGTLSCYG
jgi:hypothetical protein